MKSILGKENVRENLAKVIEEMLKRYQIKPQRITLNEILQPPRKEYREYLLPEIEKCLLPESRVRNIEGFEKLYHLFRSGKKCLILSEHKSNLDVPLIHILLTQAGQKYAEMFESILFIAGRKLLEQNAVVALFAHMYHKLVLASKFDSVEGEEQEAFELNFEAQKMIRKHMNDYIYFIFPTARRSRPWDPESYRGVPEIINYIRQFDYVIYLSIDGNCMFPLPETSMSEEPILQDNIVLTFSDPIKVSELLKGDFSKQEKIDAIMNCIYAQKQMPPQQENWVAFYEEYMKRMSSSS